MQDFIPLCKTTVTAVRNVLRKSDVLEDDVPKRNYVSVLIELLNHFIRILLPLRIINYDISKTASMDQEQWHFKS